MPVRKLLLAKPRGFCAGVDRAIDVVNLALELYPGPVYVRKEIVHNVHVVNDLRAKGAVFVDELDEVPDGATVIFSAHGVSPEVRAGATARGLKVIDATCPLVTKVHHEAIRFAREGRPIVLVGHEGHDEVVGTMGHAPEHIHLIGSAEEAETLEVSDPNRVAVITQTTLSLDDTSTVVDVLRRRFPDIEAPTRDDICYATQNRQLAVKAMARRVPAILVIGLRGEQSVNDLLTLSQVILGIQLPFAMLPLLQFTSSKLRMGKYANGKFLLLAGWTSCILITALDIYGLSGILSDALR